MLRRLFRCRYAAATLLLFDLLLCHDALAVAADYRHATLPILPLDTPLTLCCYGFSLFTRYACRFSYAAACHAIVFHYMLLRHCFHATLMLLPCRHARQAHIAMLLPHMLPMLRC